MVGLLRNCAGISCTGLTEREGGLMLSGSSRLISKLVGMARGHLNGLEVVSWMFWVLLLVELLCL